MRRTWVTLVYIVLFINLRSTQLEHRQDGGVKGQPVQVKSQTNDWPRDHGMRVTPSGFFSSVRDNPGGSSSTGCQQNLEHEEHEPWFASASDSSPYTHYTCMWKKNMAEYLFKWRRSTSSDHTNRFSNSCLEEISVQTRCLVSVGQSRKCNVQMLEKVACWALGHQQFYERSYSHRRDDERWWSSFENAWDPKDIISRWERYLSPSFRSNFDITKFERAPAVNPSMRWSVDTS